MTLIVVQICDHCGEEARGTTFECYRVEGQERRHICSSCQKKPFRAAQTPHERARIVADSVRLMLKGPEETTK